MLRSSSLERGCFVYRNRGNEVDQATVAWRLSLLFAAVVDTAGGKCCNAVRHPPECFEYGTTGVNRVLCFPVVVRVLLAWSAEYLTAEAMCCCSTCTRVYVCVFVRVLVPQPDELVIGRFINYLCVRLYADQV